MRSRDGWHRFLRAVLTAAVLALAGPCVLRAQQAAAAADSTGPSVQTGMIIRMQLGADTALVTYETGHVMRVGRCLAVRLDRDEAAETRFMALMFAGIHRADVYITTADHPSERSWVAVPRGQLDSLGRCDPELHGD